MKWSCLYSTTAVSLIFPLSQALQCYTPGECSGGQITDYIEDTDTYNDCLRFCQEDPDADCQWFTHFPNKVCLHFDGCPTINQECTDCFSGEKNCAREIICNAQGGCDGIAIGYPVVQNVQECRKACYETPGCEWYTYLPTPKFCTLTEDCPEIDYNCNGDECVHGEKACFLQESKSLLVIGGTNGGLLSNVEVLDFGSNSSCALSSYPDERGGLVGTMLGGNITVCGGFGYISSRYDDCNIYDPENNIWKETTTLLSRRAGAIGIMLNDSAWWITGGNSDGRSTAETELKFADGGAEYYTDLPESFSYHHFFKINSTHAVLTEGSATFGKHIYMFNTETEEWFSLPDIPERNYDFHAGLVTFPNGTRMIVVAGGYVVNYCYGLDLDSLEWTHLPTLPIHIFAGTSVQNNFTFYIIGGRQFGGTTLDSIFEFDVNEKKWRELPQRLNVPGVGLAAFLIPSNIINCDATSQDQKKMHK